MINEETLSILDDIEALSDMIVDSATYHDYIEAKELLYQDDEAHLLYSAFLKSKDKYDDVMRFGRYHPDYKTIMMETRQRKEHMKCYQWLWTINLKKWNYKI